ncbi:hypothetical protein K438DRAFT_1969575 [Mycena galopus ATCC 62051]|nr:hypothetical protein K438DRAFT_1969575 [Mycena galopus ATCC 62051]
MSAALLDVAVYCPPLNGLVVRMNSAYSRLEISRCFFSLNSSSIQSMDLLNGAVPGYNTPSSSPPDLLFPPSSVSRPSWTSSLGDESSPNPPPLYRSSPPPRTSLNPGLHPDVPFYAPPSFLPRR